MKKRILNEKQIAIINELKNKPVNELLFHFSLGNTKLPFMNYGTPAVMTCPAAACNNCSCCDFCYEVGIEDARTTVFKNNYENILLWIKDPARFEQLFDNALKLYALECKLTGRPAIMRLNESGDFFSISYTKMIIRRITENTDIFFYGYTKQWIDKRFDFISDLQFHALNNCNIMFSAVDNIQVPEKYKKYYKIAYTGNLEKSYEIIETGRAIHCCGNCEKCNICVYGSGNVCFVIHGKKGIDKIPEKVNFPYVNAAGLKCELPRYVNKNNTHFYKSSATTFQGVRDIICKKILNKNDYETRTTMLYETYKLYRAGKIEVYKNGFVINM